MAELAHLLGKYEDEKKYRRLSYSYRNIYDKSKSSFRPKDKDGNFMPWPEAGRLQEGYGCIESNPYQQGWFVPHDVEGMIELMGGKEKVIADLDTMFANTPSHFLWNKYYNHANEPVHHVPYLYNRLGHPWKTQYWTQFICNNAYGNSVNGLVGNEDVGQMSAWYVLSAIGLHPICPGDTCMEITTPLFDKIKIHLLDNKIFRIDVHRKSKDKMYISELQLNGKDYTEFSIDYNDIKSGGKLDIYLYETFNNNLKH